MSRRAATAVLTLSLGLALTACGKAKHADDVPNDSATPTSSVGNPAGDPNGNTNNNASPSTSLKLAEGDRTASFDGAQAQGGYTYTVTLQMGKPQKADGNLVVSPDGDVTSQRAVNLGTAISTFTDGPTDNTRCIDPDKDLVIPFSLTVDDTSDFRSKFRVGFMVVDAKGDRIEALTQYGVALIRRSSGDIRCDIDAGAPGYNAGSLGSATFDLEAGETGQTGGFIVLHNVVTQNQPDGNAGMYKGYKLGVSTSELQSLNTGFDKITSMQGFDGTVKSLTDVTTGGQLLLVK